MNSSDLQQNFILFLENQSKESSKNLNRRLCCEKCRFSTKDANLFERHVAHHKEVTFSCNLCNHVSYSRVESQRHAVIHKGSFPYKCTWCSYGAVRRDYMVKHIQRIHGKTAEGKLLTDCIVQTPKMEHLSQQGTTALRPDTTSRPLNGPLKNVQFMNCSMGNVFSLSNVNQSKEGAPYIMAKPVQQMTSNRTQSATSTTCILPVPKSQPRDVLPNNLSSFSHVVNKVTLGVNSSPNVTITGTSQPTTEPINKVLGKTLLEKPKCPLPRVHVRVTADRPVQQKPLQVGTTADKAVVQLSTIPKVQVGLPVGRCNQLKTLLGTPVETSGQRAVSVQNMTQAPTVQRSVYSGVRNVPVANTVQKTVVTVAHPSTLMERFGQNAPSFTPSTSSIEKPAQQKTRPNILVKTPSEKFRSSTQPSVQVELLAPLNQPIQHNKPLTVSCPEEITIPAGCLVELVEVKNINGTRELELRLVPQHPGGIQPQIFSNETAAGAAGRVSFKCKVAAEDQPTRLNPGKGTLQTNAVPESQVKGVCLKDSTVTVKDEPEVNEALTGVTHASSGGGSFHRAPKLPSSDSPKAGQAPRTERPCTGRLSYLSATNKNLTTEHLELRDAEGGANKQEEVEFTYQGLPVISSVFSLCSIPEVTLHDAHSKTDTQIFSASGSNTEESKSCNVDLKKEEEIGPLIDTLHMSNKEVKEKGQVLERVVPEKIHDVTENSSQTFVNDLKDSIVPRPRRPSADILHPDANVLELCRPAAAPSDPVSSKNFPQDEAVGSELDSSCHAEEDTHRSPSMNPKVALVRMPSLDFYSLVETAKKVPERSFGEECVTARPVLCCKSNEQNLPERSIKLVLKRKHSENENSLGRESHLALAHFDILPPPKKHKKDKKRAKKHRAKYSLDFHQISVKGPLEGLWLTPLKDDQPVKRPGPNQPVVVLNHPNPAVRLESADVLKDHTWMSSSPDLSTEKDTLPTPTRQCPSLKMKLKKVQGQKYQVIELLLKGVFEEKVFL